MAASAFLAPLAGGVLIGLASASVLLFEGRIAGISGMMGGLVSRDARDRSFPALFLGGLVIGGLVASLLWPHAFGAPMLRAPLLAVGGGLAVGLGTQLGGGCTSGHGVCGIGRLSKRSIVATVTFMGTGAVAALAVRLLGGGA